MGRPYSEDLRTRIVRAVEAGATRRAAARVFGVSASCAVKLLQAWQRTGTVSAKRQGPPLGSKLDRCADLLIGLVKDQPDITLEEIRAKLRQRGVSASIGLVWSFYDRHDISFKKNAARKRAAAA